MLVTNGSEFFLFVCSGFFVILGFFFVCVGFFLCCCFLGFF